MRLLNTTSLCFEEFFDKNIPQYAILSHRWEGKEIGFHEFDAGKERDAPEFAKIKNCCSFAERHGHKWVWIDTCCIDKKSSAELSEAINSMYRWYQRSQICYAYLSDVNEGPWKTCKHQFRKSVWFTRGWTLQELLAPRGLVFLNNQWKNIGTRHGLANEIADITGIKGGYGRAWNKASVATKMSWVSKRQTSRIEDMAYCLLGIFDVTMPLLYGEGKRAFMRLQLEIISKSDDESIFAWTSSDLERSPPQYQGMLASWPTWFADSKDIITDIKMPPRPPYLMTNKGLEFRIPADAPSQDVIKVTLNCGRETDKGHDVATINLFRFGNIANRYDQNWADFKDPDYIKEQSSNTDVVYIPQFGL